MTRRPFPPGPRLPDGSVPGLADGYRGPANQPRPELPGRPPSPPGIGPGDAEPPPRRFSRTELGRPFVEIGLAARQAPVFLTDGTEHDRPEFVVLSAELWRTMTDRSSEARARELRKLAHRPDPRSLTPNADTLARLRRELDDVRAAVSSRPSPWPWFVLVLPAMGLCGIALGSAVVAVLVHLARAVPPG